MWTLCIYDMMCYVMRSLFGLNDEFGFELFGLFSEFKKDLVFWCILKFNGF